jgi:hypothetical protein
MTDLETIPEPAAPVMGRPRKLIPDPFTKMGAVAQQLWRAAQDTDRPDAPFITCGELASILGAPVETTSANLTQLRHRGLVAQIHKPRASGRGTIALYGLTDAGAVACAAAFGG